MELLVTPAGEVRALYDEAIPLAALGAVSIRRASHVEPNDEARWMADLAPVGGPVLGPFAARSQALVAETEWLTQHWLVGRTAARAAL
jgi:hypothetical protein